MKLGVKMSIFCLLIGILAVDVRHGSPRSALERAV